MDTSLDTAVDFSVDFGFDAGFNFTPQNIAILVIIVIAIVYLINNMDKTEGFRGRRGRRKSGKRRSGRRRSGKRRSGKRRSRRSRSRKRYRIPGYRRRGKLYGRWWSPRRGYGRRYGRRFGRRWCGEGSCEGRSPIYNRDYSLANCLRCKDCGICEYDDGAMECVSGDVYGPNDPYVYPEDCACWYHGKEGGCWPRGMGGYGGYSWNRV